MNIFKRLAALCFHKKPAASETQSAAESQDSAAQKVEPKPEECCRYVKLGKAECPLFAPYPLMQFYSIYKAYQLRSMAIAHVDQVKLFELHHPQTKVVLATVWALPEAEGYVWGEVGGVNVNYSEGNAFDYVPTQTCDIVMCKKDGVIIVAECQYKKQEIRAVKLFREDETGKERQPMKCSKLPCSLEKLAKFLEKKVTV